MSKVRGRYRPPDDARRGLFQLFASLDKNHDGRLSLVELARALHPLACASPIPEPEPPNPNPNPRTLALIRKPEPES